MSALFSRLKTWVSKEKLTASDLNAEFDNIINNLAADKISGASDTVGNMQVTTDPGEVGSESLSSEIRGEIRRLRHMVGEIVNGAQWYTSPVRNLSTSGQYVVATSTAADPSVADKDILVMDTSSAAITLQGLQGGISGQILMVIKTDTTNSLTIADTGTGTQKIKTDNGNDGVIAAANRGGMILYFNGTDWTSIAASSAVEMANSITTTSITDAAVTRAKLSALGQQVSSSSDTNLITGGAGVFADVTNLSVSITTTGRPVFLCLIPESGSVDAVLQLRNTTTTSGLERMGISIRFVRDTTNIARWTYAAIVDSAHTGTDAVSIPSSSVFHVDVVTAGTYTYKVQAARLTGNEDDVAIFESKLVAFEL